MKKNLIIATYHTLYYIIFLIFINCNTDSNVKGLNVKETQEVEPAQLEANMKTVFEESFAFLKKNGIKTRKDAEKKKEELEKRRQVLLREIGKAYEEISDSETKEGLRKALEDSGEKEKVSTTTIQTINAMPEPELIELAKEVRNNPCKNGTHTEVCKKYHEECRRLGSEYQKELQNTPEKEKVLDISIPWVLKNIHYYKHDPDIPRLVSDIMVLKAKIKHLKDNK